MIVWMILFALFATCFFVVAAVVSVRGWGDLRELLRRSSPAGSRQDEHGSGA